MRQFILFLASAILITGFFLLKPNRTWFRDRLIAYYGEFPRQCQTMKVEERMANRFGNYYSISKQIAAALKEFSKDTSEDLVLLPPTAYFEKNGLHYHVPEPVVFYYFTGIRTVWANSPHAKEANWYVYVSKGEMHIRKVTSPERLLPIIAAFNKYEITL